MNKDGSNDILKGIIVWLLDVSFQIFILIDQIKLSLNLKGNPMCTLRTAFRTPCTTVQIAAWSPNRPSAQILILIRTHTVRDVIWTTIVGIVVLKRKRIPDKGKCNR